MATVDDDNHDDGGGGGGGGNHVDWYEVRSLYWIAMTLSVNYCYHLNASLSVSVSVFRTTLIMRIYLINMLHICSVCNILHIYWPYQWVNEWVEWKQKNRYTILYGVEKFICPISFLHRMVHTTLAYHVALNTTTIPGETFMKIAFVFRFSCPSSISTHINVYCVYFTLLFCSVLILRLRCIPSICLLLLLCFLDYHIY